MLDTILNTVVLYLPDALSVLGALTVLTTVVAKLTKNTVDDTVARALVWVRDKAVWLGTLRFVRDRALLGKSANSLSVKKTPVRDQRRKR